jgi:cytochrome c oxidase subunit 1
MDDWWRQKYGVAGHEAAHAAPAMAGASEDGAHAAHVEHHEVHIHMPDPSYFPIIVAIGMFVMACGLIITNYWICLLGFAILFAGIYGWSFEPVNAPAPLGSAEVHASPAPSPRAPVAAH